MEVQQRGGISCRVGMKNPSRRPLRQFLRHGLNALLPRKLFLTTGPRNGRQIALTFDDGPHPEWTPMLLDRLQHLSMRATFFVLGREAERYPDLVRRMIREGHTVGNHTWSHSEPEQTSVAVFRDELLRTNRLLEDLTGRNVSWVRPPKGKLTVGKMSACWRAGMSIALWNVDPRDYAMSAAIEVRRKLHQHLWQSGDVILMHDVHPHAVEVVHDLQLVGESFGLSFVTLNDWLRTSDSAVLRKDNP